MNLITQLDLASQFVPGMGRGDFKRTHTRMKIYACVCLCLNFILGPTCSHRFRSKKELEAHK